MENIERTEPSGILIVNKPAGCTSHDVVNRVRKLYKTRRVGHTGTLDPMATGVLVVLVGRAAKAAEYLVSDEKKDLATLRLILEEKLPALETAWGDVYEGHMYHKDNYLRPFGAERMDMIYGTHIMRTKCAIRRLDYYLCGQVDSLPELEEERFDEGAAAWGWEFENLIDI